MKAAIPAVVTVAILAAAAVESPRAQTAPDRAKVLRAAADALGLVRWSDIGNGATILPGIDIVNTMEFEGDGTSESGGRMLETRYHAAVGYNPPAMRVEMTRTPDGAAPQRSIQTVRETFAWDESEIGAGLIPGKGTATPTNAALQERLLQLWTLPYGVVKGVLAAGEKTTIASEAGATIVTFPLTGQLAGITVRATLDASSLVTKVETRPDNAALTALATETQYSNYMDRGEVLSDIKSPGRIVRRQGGRTMLDIEVTQWDTNNPYLVFPVPPNVKAATANSR